MEAWDAMNNLSNNIATNAQGKAKGTRSSGVGPSQQRNTNWNKEEVLALVRNKHKEHIYLKHLVNPRSNMILATKRWNKLRRPIIKNNFKDTKKRKDVQGQVELYQQ
jgi:hypothetical protein